MEVEKNLAEQELVLEAYQDVYNLLRLSPQGISQKKLFEGLKHHDRKNLAEAINALFNESKIIIENIKTDPVIKLLSDKEVLKLRDLSGEEYRVYEIIIGCGSSGISLNELKSQIEIASTALQKIRGKLKKKQLIKDIPVPNMRNKKVMMGFEIEPSNELRGGFWCTNQQFDQSLIDVIGNRCVDYLEKQGMATRKEILVYIKSTGLVNNEIKEEDLQKVLNVLVFDDKIEVNNLDGIVNDSGSKYGVLLKKNDTILNSIKYKVSVDFFIDFTALESTPCAFCPVFEDCNVNNVVNPMDCTHMSSLFDELF